MHVEPGAAFEINFLIFLTIAIAQVQVKAKAKVKFRAVCVYYPLCKWKCKRDTFATAPRGVSSVGLFLFVSSVLCPFRCFLPYTENTQDARAS